MITVRSKNKNRNQYLNNQKLISQFKSLVNDEQIIETYNDNRYYVKPSLRKRLKREAAQRQRAKDFINDVKEILQNKNEIYWMNGRIEFVTANYYKY